MLPQAGFQLTDLLQIMPDFLGKQLRKKDSATHLTPALCSAVVEWYPITTIDCVAYSLLFVYYLNIWSNAVYMVLYYCILQ